MSMMDKEAKHRPNYRIGTLPDGGYAIIDTVTGEAAETFSPVIRKSFVQTRYTELWKEALGIK